MRYIMAVLFVCVVTLGFIFPKTIVLAETDGGNNVNTALDGGNNVNSAVLENPLDSSISTIPAFFSVLIDILLVFAIPFIVFFIIYAGFLYVTAQGNAEKIKTAHNALLYALIGGMLILGANVLLDIITNTVDQIN
jgi:hypothetical protein